MWCIRVLAPSRTVSRPNKAYVFRQPKAWALRQQGFDPLVSFARGGLAEAWTGGSYELDERDLSEFPFSLGDLQPHYATVARRIGITGERDDLQRFSPMSAAYDPPLPLDTHSAHLLDAYQRKRQGINALGVYMGRSRVAVLTQDRGERHACTQLGRCLMGCPRESLYAPSYTLRELPAIPRFYLRARCIRGARFRRRQRSRQWRGRPPR